MEPVVHSSELVFDFPRSRKVVWDFLIHHIDKWWHPDFHELAPNSRIALEPHVGGRLFEYTDDGSALLWYTVTQVRPEIVFELSGFISQDWGGPAVSTLRINLESRGDSSTRFTVQESTFGALPSETVKSLRDGWYTLFAEGFQAALSTHPARS